MFRANTANKTKNQYLYGSQLCTSSWMNLFRGILMLNWLICECATQPLNPSDLCLTATLENICW